MDETRYSLNDIFGFLREATLLLDKSVLVVSEDKGVRKNTEMLLSEFIAMSLASEFVSETSRMASDLTTAKKADVIEALKANYYGEVTYPVYEHFGIRIGGGKKSTRKTARRR